MSVVDSRALVTELFGDRLSRIVPLASTHEAAITLPLHPLPIRILVGSLVLVAHLP